jgi:histidine triad (HIT) family protein
MNDCAFCKRITDGEYEKTDYDNVVSFIPLNPVVDGHRLFVPTEHFAEPKDNTYMYACVSEVVAIYLKENPHQANIITNVGHDASQTIQHLHIHVVPRSSHDGLLLPWTNQIKGASK